ncbi:MAG: nucleotidyltransferase [Lentisphaerae bacterium GWF2_44_16]|nr:MAG: nucleotidyltransferase [Lentisphaerae bacterium GWF2_44_16]
MKPTLLVLAAGIGSRYGGLKQIDPVGPSGEIIIDYSIYDAIRAGFDRAVFVIRKDIEETFKEVIGSRYQGKIKIDYAYQELDKLPPGFSVPADRKKPWGTGHAILMCKDIIDTPFAVINGDDFYGKSGFKVLADYLSSVQDGERAEYSMAGFVLRNTLSEFGTVARGVCYSNDSGFLESVEELTKIEKLPDGARNINEDGTFRKLSGNEIASMNMWGFTTSIFKHLETQFPEFLTANAANLKSEFFIPSVVNRLLKEDKANVKVLRSTDSWFGITYKEDKPEVIKSINSLIENKIYPAKLF